ncbi:probable insulin-like peptide 3 [Anopheles nili]|uniref:probable insulin-like peptide 3 n=1 Tax=Anopheles nili TaxID=185578 RepID=UPI00237C1436|nr:probable insulin-like peptide 3 [Anopheles nili]
MASVRFFLYNVCCLVVIFGNLQTTSAKRYCGVQLTNVLSFLCVEYYSMDDVKRNTGFGEKLIGHPETYQLGSSSEDSNEEMSFNEVPQFEQNVVHKNWFPRWFKLKSPSHDTTRYGRAFHKGVMERIRRNVADECCYKDCSMDQLLSYCKVAAPGVVSL